MEKKRKLFFSEISKPLRFMNDNLDEKSENGFIPIEDKQCNKKISSNDVNLSKESSTLFNLLNCELSPSKLELQKEKLIICVYIRGDITQKIYSIWSKALPKKLPSYNIEVSQNIRGDSNYLIVSSNLTVENINNWKKSQLTFDDYLRVEKIPCVTSSWVIDILKYGKLPSSLASYLFDQSHNISPIEEISKDFNCQNQIKGPVEGNSLLTSLSSVDLSFLTSQVPSTEIVNISLKEKIRNSFACALSGTQEILFQNQNGHIIDVLEDLQGIYDLSGDEWRTQGYKKCIGILRKLPKITSIEQLGGIKGIGRNMKAKIKEIIETKQLKKLQYFKEDPKIKSLTELSQIWGVGEKTASNLIRKGFYSVQDLLDHGMNILTDQQIIGVKYYNEFLAKIPRQEVEEIANMVDKNVQLLFPGSNCTICGSYRRGKPQSGDVDILISPPIGQDELPSDALPKIIKSLTLISFLTDHLALPPGYYEMLKEYPPEVQNPTPFIRKHRCSYMGVCLLPGDGRLHRRIDIKIYPQDLLPFAMLYFTGSDHFNRSMRLFAKKKGFQLNDKGLKYREKVPFYSDFPYKIGESISCFSEEEIFAVLGLEYKRPEDRNILDIGHLLPTELICDLDDEPKEYEDSQFLGYESIKFDP